MINLLFTIIVSAIYLLGLLLSFNKKYVLWPMFFVFFAYFFKPFFSRLIFYFEPVAAVFDPLSVVMALLFPFTFVVYYLRNKHSIKVFLRSRLTVLLLLFIFIYFIQIFNPNTILGAGFLTFKNLAMLLFSFFLPFYLIKYKYPYKNFVSMLLVFGIVYLAYGLYQVFFGHAIFEQVYFAETLGELHYRSSMFMEGQTRPCSFATNDGHFRYTMVLLFLFLLPQYRCLTIKNKKLFILYSFLFLLLFFLSPDRTPILMTLIGIFTIYILGNGKRWPIRLLAGVLLFVPILSILRTILLPYLATLSSGQYLYRLIELLDLFNAGTWVTRSSAGGDWSRAIMHIKEFLLFGAGAGTGTFNRLGGSMNLYVMTHNEFLTVLLETGIVGFFVFIVLIFYLLFVLYKLIVMKNGFFKQISLGIIASFISLLASSMVNIALLSGESSRMAWLFVGFIPILLNRQLKEIFYEHFLGYPER